MAVNAEQQSLQAVIHIKFVASRALLQNAKTNNI